MFVGRQTYSKTRGRVNILKTRFKIPEHRSINLTKKSTERFQRVVKIFCISEGKNKQQTHTHTSRRDSEDIYSCPYKSIFHSCDWIFTCHVLLYSTHNKLWGMRKRTFWTFQNWKKTLKPPNTPTKYLKAAYLSNAKWLCDVHESWPV